MSAASRPEFTAAAPPADPREARLLGLYAQRQEGLLMQRLKAGGGRLTVEQWRAVLDLAGDLTPDHPLRLTTRQDLEFHGLRPELVPEVQRRLAAAGLTTLGACGDTLRNITECPGCAGPDLGPLAGRIREALGGLDCLFSLPRKFKISLSACAEACAKPWINDLGLAANPDGTFRAVLGGSLGPAPGLGLLCYESLVPADVPALAVAAVRLHDVEGDRGNRRRARLRHVRERLGDGEFRRRLDGLFRAELARNPPAPLALGPAGRPGRALRLAVAHGELPADAIRALLVAVEVAGGSLSAGLEHDLLVNGLGVGELPAVLRDRVGAPRVVACPAAHLCVHGLVETRELSDAIRAALPPVCDLTVALSGCPNNCTHAPVADIGLVGRVRKVDGLSRPHFRLLAGGGGGRSPEVASELDPAVPAAEVPERVRQLVGLWLSSGASDGTGFSAWFRTRASEKGHG